MSSKTILDCDKALQKAWSSLVTHLRKTHPQYRLRIEETHVPPEEQKERFNIGRNGLGEITGSTDRTVTNFDGTDKVTLFNYYPSKAVRFHIIDKLGLEVWPIDIYQTIANIAANQHIGYEAPDVLYRE